MNQLYEAALKFINDNPCELTGNAAQRPMNAGETKIPIKKNLSLVRETEENINSR